MKRQGEKQQGGQVGGQREGTRDGIFKRLRSPGIDSASLCSLVGRYDNPIPTRFLAPIDRSKIPAQIGV